MNNLLKKFHTPTWLFVLLILVLVFRIPSFFEPYSYGDEMIYLTLGEAIRRGIPLYSGIHDNKPPLLYVLAAIAGSLFWFKAILTIWTLCTIFVFWKLASFLFPKKESFQKVATTIFAVLTTLPLLEGNIVNAELFMIGPTMLAFYLLLTRRLDFKNLFFSGILFSTASLFKIPAAFDIPAILFVWIFSTKKFDKSGIVKILRNTFFLSLGFLLPILATFIWYFLRGAASEYLTAAYLQNFGYLSSFRPGDIQKPFLIKNAPLIQRSLVLIFGLLILFWKRKRLSKEFSFSVAWLLFSLFAVTLSERPYPHYLIQSVPPLSILLGILFTQKNIEQVLVIIPLTLTLFVPVYYKFWYYKTTPYYLRFINFTLGKIDKKEYLSSFSKEAQENYEVANFVVSVTMKDEKIFVWGSDSPVIYALSRRLPIGKYVAEYHIKDFSTQEDTAKQIASDMPGVVVVLPNSSAFPMLNIFLRKNYGLVKTIGSTQIWRLLGPKLRDIDDLDFVK